MPLLQRARTGPAKPPDWPRPGPMGWQRPLVTRCPSRSSDAADDLVGTGEMAVDAASSPVRVGAAEVATFAAAWETAADREDRVARNHTMPISTATASTTAATLRTQ